MRSKGFLILFLILLYLLFLMFFPGEKSIKIEQILSPCEFILSENKIFKLQDFQCFDSNFTENNKVLASKLNLSEDEAFILGNLAKYWTIQFMQNRQVILQNNDLKYSVYSYSKKYEYSPYAIKDYKIVNPKSFEKTLNYIKNSKYVVLDTDTNTEYGIQSFKNSNIDNYILIRKGYKRGVKKQQDKYLVNNSTTQNNNNIKLILVDGSTKSKPDKSCTSLICKEIVKNINQAQKSIDLAIYGYSQTYEIERSIKDAIKRGVKIRLIYDTKRDGTNIYPDTNEFVNLFKNKQNDKNSEATMHNKFFIFDNKKIITGSANLSHTDMSGFNTNGIVIIDSPEIANIYLQEFEQMFAGKFHTEKQCQINKKIDKVKVYFSPQDKTITNGIIPLIKNAKKYIYIPTFVITEKRVVEELINARQRGVEIKIILDALSASNKHSNHNILRENGIQLKAENFAGKLHSKSMIIDDEFLIIGSMNLSYSGENKNDENSMIIKDKNLAILYKDFFLKQWNKIPNKWLYLTPKAESWDSIGSCNDGIDNDYDGKTDLLDEACQLQ